MYTLCIKEQKNVLQILPLSEKQGNFAFLPKLISLIATPL